MCDCETRLKNLSATGGGCVGARVAGGSPGAATRSSRGMRVRFAPATLAGVSRNARGNRVGRAGRCDWSGTGHSPEELAIGDVRLKLDPLLVEASPAVDGERIHVLRRAHVPAGGEDQPWYGRKGKRRGVSEGRRRGQKVKNRAGEFSGRGFLNDDRWRGWRGVYSPRSEISLSSHVRSITSGSTIASSPSVASGRVVRSAGGGSRDGAASGKRFQRARLKKSGSRWRWVGPGRRVPASLRLAARVTRFSLRLGASCWMGSSGLRFFPAAFRSAARSNLASSASAGTSLLWPAATFAMMSARPATAESFFLVDRVRAATGTSSLATV